MTLHYGPRTDQFCDETFEVEEDTMNEKHMTLEMIAESIVDEIRGEYTKRRPTFEEAVALLAETLTKYEQHGAESSDNYRRGVFDAMDAAAKAETSTMFPQFEPTPENELLWEAAVSSGVMNAVQAIRALPISPQPQQESEDVE